MMVVFPLPLMWPASKVDADGSLAKYLNSAVTAGHAHVADIGAVASQMVPDYGTRLL